MAATHSERPAALARQARLDFLDQQISLKLGRGVRHHSCRFFFARMIGIRIADITQAIAMKSAGVALRAAFTETHLPMDRLIVALISSGWGAGVGES